MTASSDLSCSSGVIVNTPGRAPAHLLVIVDSTVGKFTLIPSMVNGSLVLTLINPDTEPVVEVIAGMTAKGMLIYRVHPANTVTTAPVYADIVKRGVDGAHTRLADVLTVYRAVVKIKLRLRTTEGRSVVESLFTSASA